MKVKRNEIPVKLKIIDLDEIPDQIDISINLPEKKVPDATKTTPKSNSVTLF